MERSTGRSLLIALLSLFLLPAAAPTPESAYRDVRALYDQSRLTDVVHAADQALVQFGNRDDDAIWRIRELRALALIGGGDWKAVRSAAEPELPQRLQRSDVAVDRLRALAIAEYNLSQFDDMKRHLDAGERIASSRQLAQLRMDRAQMRRYFPADERIRAAHEAYRAANRTTDVKLQARAIGVLGFVLASENRYDEAIEYAEKASRVFAKLGDQARIEQTELNLGWLYNMLGDSESAAEHLQRALDLAVKLGANANRLVALQQLGDTEVARGNLDSARRDYTEAWQLAEKTESPYRGTALLLLAQLAFRRGDLDGAHDLNAQALALNEQAKEANEVFQSRILDARIGIARGQFDDASKTLADVIASAKAKSILWEAQGRLAQVFAAQHDNERAEEHFDDAVSKTEEARDAIQKEDRRLSFAELSKELNDSYVEFLISAGKPRDALRVAESYRARSLAAERETFEPERVARDANVVVLSYWLAAKRSYVWIVKSSGVEVFALPPSSEIESAIDSYQRALLQSRSSDAEGKRLYNILVQPAAGSLRGVRRIAIIPDGRIATFNLETVVVPAPRPHYWIEDVTIQRAASLQLLAPSSRVPTSNRMLLIGNAPQADPGFPPLRHAGAEIDRVRRHFDDTTTLAGANATPHAYFASKPESFAFLHFVAHGVAVRLQPLDSAVILGRDRDGYKLYARDIAQHPLRARLVTISSCHGAGRRAFAGEGLVGLAWAFMRAGAHEVIASLWEVNDEAAPEFMDVMYTAIRAGRDPADALRAAKLKMLRSNTIYRKPLYWAPFVLYSRS
jgi:CHAT domain-containing protein